MKGFSMFQDCQRNILLLSSSKESDVQRHEIVTGHRAQSGWVRIETHTSHSSVTALLSVCQSTKVGKWPYSFHYVGSGKTAPKWTLTEGKRSEKRMKRWWEGMQGEWQSRKSTPVLQSWRKSLQGTEQCQQVPSALTASRALKTQT